MNGMSNGTGTRTGKKDYAWLKDRYTALMGRAPQEKDLERLMRVKDLLEIDYDDPALLHLLAFEYYGQLYEEMPAKIRTVIAQTEAHASNHFEQAAAEISQQQAALFTKASHEALRKLVEGGNKMIAEIGDEGKRAMSSFLLNEFRNSTKPEFIQAGMEARMAADNIRAFVRQYWFYLLGCTFGSGLVSAAVVLALVYLYK